MIKKMCDYLKQFGEVNRILIDDDADKKARGKRTRRQEITPLFVRATECMETILRLLHELKVQSMFEVKHKDG